MKKKNVMAALTAFICVAAANMGVAVSGGNASAVITAYAEEITEPAAELTDETSETEVLETEADCTEEEFSEVAEEEIVSAADAKEQTEEAVVKAPAADFVIAGESFKIDYSKNNSQIVFSRINSDGTLTEAGSFFTELFMDIVKYEVFGSNEITVTFGGEFEVEESFIYENGVFKRVSQEDIDNGTAEHQSERQKFTLDGVNFIAEIYRDYNDNYKDYFSVYFEDGTPTNIYHVEQELMGGTASSSGFNHNANNFYKVSDDTLTVYRYGNGPDGSDHVQSVYGTFKFDKASMKFVKAGEETSSENVTQAMLHDKFVAKYGESFAYYEEEFVILNGVPTLFVSVSDPHFDDYKGFVHTYQVTADGISLIDIVGDSNGGNAGMGFRTEYKNFSCNGYDFLLKNIGTGNDGFINQYITIYRCNADGTLNCTNIKNYMIKCCPYAEKNGEFKTWGDTTFTLEGLFSSTADKIVIRRVNEYADMDESTSYKYDAATNTFVPLNGTENENKPSEETKPSENNNSTSTTSSSPATSDSTNLPAATAAAAVVLGSVVWFSKKRK